MSKPGYRRRFTLEVSLPELRAMRAAAGKAKMSTSAWLRSVVRIALGAAPDGGPGLLIEGRDGTMGRVGVKTFEALRKAASEGRLKHKLVDPFEVMAAAHKRGRA
jgi:hypothetical protein